MTGSIPPLDTSPFADLRRQIDAIDDAIQDLIARRTLLVEQVGALKRVERTATLQPAREAAILRRLVARHRGKFPAAALVRIWREIITASLRLESPFTVAVFAPGRAGDYWNLARDHFGAAEPAQAYDTPGQVVGAVSDAVAHVGILPWPENAPHPWWAQLFGNAKEPVRIFARLPFLQYDDDATSALRPAVAIGRVPPQPSGHDRSFLGFETAADTSRFRLSERLKRIGLDGLNYRHGEDADFRGHGLHLVEVDGFIALDDERLAALRAESPEAIRAVVHLGSYAVPLTVARHAPAISSDAG